MAKKVSATGPTPAPSINDPKVAKAKSKVEQVTNKQVQNKQVANKKKI